MIAHISNETIKSSFEPSSFKNIFFIEKIDDFSKVSIIKR
jgi:hypothetical protein